MKKGAIARLVIWSVTALLLIGLLTSVLVFRGLKNGNISIGPSGYTYKNAADYSVGGGEIYDEITSVEVNWVNGGINIEVYDGDCVQVSETGAEDEDDRMRYLIRNGRLIIQYRKSGFSFGLSNNQPKEVTVKLPYETAAGLVSVETESASAEVRIAGITASECDISNVSGEIRLEEVKLGRLDYETVSGNITASGEIASLEGDSTSGDVTVISAAAPAKIDCESVSGDIIAELPADSGFRAELDSVSGDFSSDLEVKKQGEKYICGDGRGDYSADTVSGNFIIRVLT